MIKSKIVTKNKTESTFEYAFNNKTNTTQNEERMERI